jgi:hypothetical protein
MVESASLPDLPSDVHGRMADKHTLAIALRDGTNTRCLGLAYVYDVHEGTIQIYLSNSGTHRLLWPSASDNTLVGYCIGDFSEDGWELRGLASKSLATDEQCAAIHRAMADRYPWFDKSMLTGDEYIATELLWKELTLLEIIYKNPADKPVVRITTYTRTYAGVQMHCKEKSPR